MPSLRVFDVTARVTVENCRWRSRSWRCSVCDREPDRELAWPRFRGTNHRERSDTVGTFDESHDRFGRDADHRRLPEVATVFVPQWENVWGQTRENVWGQTRFSCFLGRSQAVCLQCLAELLHLFADFWRVLHGSFGSVDQDPYAVRVGESKWGHQLAKCRYRQSSR